MVCPNCRTAAPVGSRFCNACGAAVGQGAPAAAQPTRGYRPPVAPPGAVPRHAPPAGYPQAGYPAGVPQRTIPPQAVMVPPPRKKPVALLALLLLLVLGGVGAAAVTILKRPGTGSVVTGVAAPVQSGPGVAHAASPDVPPSPGVVTSRGVNPPPGQPLTGAKQKPDDMAPSPLLVQGTDPRQGPSATVVQTPKIPSAPPLTGVVQPAPPQSPPVTGLKQPASQAPKTGPDNRDFDRYLRWLQFVEEQRAGLRAEGETQSFRVISGFYNTMLDLANPDSNDVEMQRRFDQGLQMELNRTVAGIRSFRAAILRSKPPVPSDCRALDAYYMAAVGDEAMSTGALLDAMLHKDIGQVKRLSKSGMAKIDWNLGQANNQLEKVYRGRGLNQQFRIQTGGNSSMLGGLLGLGGMGM